MNTQKNPWLLPTLSPPAIPWGTTDQGTYPGAGSADAFAVTWHGTTPSDVGLQLRENKALSWGIIGKSVHILAEITIRESQSSTVSNLLTNPRELYHKRLKQELVSPELLDKYYK
jgi:hypothetical protein